MSWFAEEFRLGKIEQRLKILDGYLVAYLNIDEVIRIIREEDDAKAMLIKAFKLSDMQADAILNMRLRHCGSSRRWKSATNTQR